MKKFFLKFLDIRVLSVIFAILIWYYVIGVQGPIVTRTFKVPITTINRESGVFITDNPAYVNIIAEGSSKVILGIKPGDFTALVNLAGKTEGEFYIPAEVKPPTSSIKIKTVSPEKVKIGLEKIATEKLPVIVKFKGKANENFIPAMPVVSPDTVTITGPYSKLKEIESAAVEVDITGINNETTLILPVQFTVKNNADISDVQVNPSSCVVKITGNNPVISKTVPIIPKIVGQPFQGFGVESISLNPISLTLSGNAEDLSNINFIETMPIDTSGATETKTYPTTLNIPDGIKVRGSKDCAVTINIAPIKKLEITVPITVNYNSTNYDAKISNKNVKVIVAGFEDVLKTISENSVTAVVDVSKFTEGTYTVPVRVNGLPQNTVISILNPEAVQIILTAKGAG